MKKFFSFLGIAVLGGLFTLGGYKMLFDKQVVVEKVVEQPSSSLQNIPANYTSAFNSSVTEAISTDFTVAAERTIHAVVHVKNTAFRTQQNPFELFFGNGSGTKKFEQIGTGSGVIISSDGYIVTNNHVIDSANEIEVTLNDKQKYKATLIGADKQNDIALLKIDATIDLPSIPFANSNNLKIGEWVLAVGNPYNLTSTVTAGIVSAKGRDLEGNGAIESFIQTDAAVNPGNSGGALVNTRGELVGINTAISSRTGSFIGYSFAVPSNIAKKIVDDLLEYGSVQEAILGINVDGSDNNIEGVKIASLSDEGGAEESGLKAGDVIMKVDNTKISKFSELRGQLTAKRPGDFVDITIDRNGTLLTKRVKLRKKNIFMSRNFGILLKDLTSKEKKKYDLSGGAKIIRNTNKNLEYYGVKKGYVITKINKKEVTDAANIAKILDDAVSNMNPIYIEVINLDGIKERYAFR